MVLFSGLCCLPAQAQEYSLTERITLVLSKTNAAEVLEKMDAQTNFTFTFSRAAFAKIPVDNIRWTSMPLSRALQVLKSDYGLDYQVQNANISFRYQAPAPKPAPVKDTARKAAGNLSGRVVDFENGDPLPGATVSLDGPVTLMGTTDEQGNYIFPNVPAGMYSLAVSFTGYEVSLTRQVKMTDQQPVLLDVKLQTKTAASFNQVVVTAITRRRVANTSDEQLVRELYNAKTVVSGISNEQIARTLDRDAAEVVKRIPGVNISEDNFVIVRGLSKRYNLTFLNDAIAPSTDADTRSFSYDVISSNAIDRIMVYKSPSPDLPGEFSGGLVKIYTKKSQLTKQLELQVSTQYRPYSTFKDVWSYAGSKYDVLGFDDGARKLPSGIPNALVYNHLNPAERAAYGRGFSNNYVVDKRYEAMPDLRANLNYYDAWRIGGRYLKNLTTIAYSNTREQRVTEANSLMKFHDGETTQGIHAARISAIQSNEISLNDRLSIELRHFFNTNNQRITIEDHRQMLWYDNMDFRHINLYYQQNQLYSGQLAGTLLLGKDKKSDLKANISYSINHKQEPDNRDYTLGRNINDGEGKPLTDDANPWRMINNIISYYTLSRGFNEVKEKNYQGNIDLNYRFNDTWGFKTGAYYSSCNRRFSSRLFALLNDVNLYDPNIAFYGSENPADNGSVTGGTNWVYERDLQNHFDHSLFREDGTGYRWYEKTTPNNQYYADNVLTAGYLSTDINLLNNRLNIYGGVRVEHNRFRILGSYETGLAAYPLVVDQPITSVLPSVNLSFKLDSSLIFRAGYGKTVNRPEFREAAPMQFISYLDQEIYEGNPDLTTVNIHNLDARIEWYPESSRRNELISAGVFYKHLDKPIERFRSVSSEGFDQFFYVNTGKAYVYGVEAEIRKSFDFIPGKFFRDLSVVVNGSWFESEVTVPRMPAHKGYTLIERKRPMQGQSPYLINASLNYENLRLGTRISATFNRAADYIYAVGANEGEDIDADIMLKARNQLDITWRQRINRTISINAGVQNVLNAPFLLYQDWKRNYSYDEIKPGKGPDWNDPGTFRTADLIYRKFYSRPYYSLGVNFLL
ncbi:MAG: TonB-dependent receptor [Candidatus Pseudobacter hemicellulosilyticus]|uniref:TonB-dependent receptor n=1 Tax=Candidatus Pseudobacter hemicellulosilyticus TaxID=3121375 RepID=A0AAJ5WTB3_9BACT|nr:MAG: TonB-dependent receptor [Pseudobacter sp.]